MNLTIYQKIKKLREDRGMSQQELAEKVGFKTASAVNKIELGLRNINQSKVIKFAKALNTTPSYLMGVDEQPHEQYDKEILNILGSLSKSDIQMLKILSSSTDEDKELILNLIKTVIDSRK